MYYFITHKPTKMTDRETFNRRIHKILELYDYAHHDTDVMEEIENLIDQLYDQMTVLKQTP